MEAIAVRTTVLRLETVLGLAKEPSQTVQGRRSLHLDTGCPNQPSFSGGGVRFRCLFLLFKLTNVQAAKSQRFFLLE
jgi:hypothetical protein